LAANPFARVDGVGALRNRRASNVGDGSMLLKKGFEEGLSAPLIQDDEQTRNLDSKNHLPGVVRFNF
jgi:hypothetical protein